MIVGISPAATDYYYRYLISAVAKEGRNLQLTMAHADTPTLLRHQPGRCQLSCPPVVALVVGGLLIHEPLHSLDVIAMLLILSGVCVLQTGKQLVPVEPAQ
jgi:hypothetical protein